MNVKNDSSCPYLLCWILVSKKIIKKFLVNSKILPIFAIEIKNEK